MYYHLSAVSCEASFASHFQLLVVCLRTHQAASMALDPLRTILSFSSPKQVNSGSLPYVISFHLSDQFLLIVIVDCAVLGTMYYLLSLCGSSFDVLPLLGIERRESV